MASKALKVVIDDGTREVPIMNKYGKQICAIHFRPADFSILDRYNDFVKDFPTIVAPLKDLDISNSGEAIDEGEGWEKLKEVEAIVIDRFNKLFDMDDAEAIFKDRNAFSSVNGEFFCSHVLSALGEVIITAINEETEKSNKKVAKYLS